MGKLSTHKVRISAVVYVNHSILLLMKIFPNKGHEMKCIYEVLLYLYILFSGPSPA